MSRAELEKRHNALVVAVSIGIGMIPLVAPTMFEHLPQWTAPFVHSGITLAAVTAVVLNVLFNTERHPTPHSVSSGPGVPIAEPAGTS